MSLLEPGGIAWLLRHELRLTFRAGAKGGRGGGSPGGWRLLIILGVVMLILGAFVGLPLGAVAQRMPASPTPSLALIADLAAGVAFLLMLSQTLAGAVESLYVRGDLDLLLSSPLDGRKILAVKGVSLALRPLLIYGALLLVAVGPAAVMGRPQWLGSLLLLSDLAALAAAAGIALALALFALIGPRATRTAGQVLAAVIGGGVFLFSQLRRYSHAASGSGGLGVMAWATPERFSPSSPLSWPARAAFGAPLPLLAITAVCMGVFAWTLAGLGRRFVRDAAVSAGVETQSARATGAGRTRRARFSRSPLWSVVRKEWRLLVRDPSLLSQVGLRVIYLAPLSYALVQGARFGGGALLASGVALVSVVAAQVAGSLAWITVSAEDAPDLLASSPLAGERTRWAKLLAALLPLAAIMAVPLLVLTVLAPWAGLVAVVGTTLSAGSSGLVNLWFGKPASRGDFRRRGGSLVTSLAEIVLGLGWGVACALAVAASIWAAAAIAVSLGLVFAFRSLRRPALGY